MKNKVIYIAIFILSFAVVLYSYNDKAHSLDSSETYTKSHEEQRTINVYKDSSDSVVYITTYTFTIDPFDFYNKVKPQEGSGSGIIVDAKKGIIVTNLHVIQDAHQVEITLADANTYKAKLLGYDEDVDLAVLRLTNPPKNLKQLEFADSNNLEVGQKVLAIGNPFGLNKTLTSGIISSLDRTVNSPSGILMKGLIQTDAAINPGNSGGPLLNMNGKLVGVNTAILSQSGDSAGIGFAVPINTIKRILPELIATGRVLKPDLGWVLIDTNQGPMVRRIFKNGPAYNAKIKPIEKYVKTGFLEGWLRDMKSADLIFKVNDKRVHNKDEVEDLIINKKKNKKIKLTLKTGGLKGRERIVILKPILK